MATYYISDSEGNDSNNGTSEGTPWKTLGRLSSATINAGDSVLLRCGDVWQEQFLNIIGQGTSGNRITYGSYGIGSKPKISGLRTITSWVNEGGGIYSYQSNDLPEYLRTVVIDGVIRAKGKFPNQGYLRITSNATTTSLTSTGLTDTINYTGAEIVSLVTPYTIDRKVISTHSGGSLTFPAMYQTNVISDNVAGTGFFIQNHISCLNDFGDWMYDTAEKRLYVYFGSDPTMFETKVSVIENLVKFERIGGAENQYKVFENFRIEGSNGNALDALDATHNIVRNLDVEYSGKGGIIFHHEWYIITGNEINRNTVKNCLSGQAISGSEYCGQSSIINYNQVENIGLNVGMLNIGDNANSTISQNGVFSINVEIIGNKVKECGYIGIHYFGQNVLIQYNFVDGAMRKLTDGGGIYTYDPSEISGGAVRRNIVVNSGIQNFENDLAGFPQSEPVCSGFYFDNGSGNFLIEENLALNNIYFGFEFNDPRTRLVNFRNNIAYNNGYSALTFRANPIIPISPTNLNFQNNIFFINRQPFEIDYFGIRNWPLVLMAVSEYANSQSGFGIMDNNYFLKNTNRDTIIVNTDPVPPSTFLSLSSWQSIHTLEINSKTQPLIDLSEATVVYNDSFSTKSYTFTGSAVDVENVEEPNTFTLEPFGFKLLIGDVTVSAGVVVSNDIIVNLANVIIG